MVQRLLLCIWAASNGVTHRWIIYRINRIIIATSIQIIINCYFEFDTFSRHFLSSSFHCTHLRWKGHLILAVIWLWRKKSHVLCLLHILTFWSYSTAFRGGFSGFAETPGYEPIELTLEKVADIHHSGGKKLSTVIFYKYHRGNIVFFWFYFSHFRPDVHYLNITPPPHHNRLGTILASSRGGFDIDVIINFLQKYRISQLYVIGGDGTHRLETVNRVWIIFKSWSRWTRTSFCCIWRGFYCVN